MRHDLVVYEKGGKGGHSGTPRTLFGFASSPAAAIILDVIYPAQETPWQINRRDFTMQRSILHVSDVRSWADEHRKRTGWFPTADSGVVKGEWNEKWANIDQALRKGLRGFPGRSSLAQLLAERRNHRNRKRLPKYTLSNILKWADSYNRRSGKWPTAKSGPIQDAPGETWLAVRSRSITASAAWPAVRRWQDCSPNGGDARNRTAVPKLSIQRSCNGRMPIRPGREIGPFWMMV